MTFVTAFTWASVYLFMILVFVYCPNTTVFANAAAPKAPENVAVSNPGDGKITLNWREPNDPSIVKYIVSCGDGSTAGCGAPVEVLPQCNSFCDMSAEIGGLDNALRLPFRVESVNSAGEKNASAPVLGIAACSCTLIWSFSYSTTSISFL